MNLDLSPLWISLKVSSIATVITFFIGLMAARLMLNYRGKLRGAIDAILISPLVLPPTVVGFLLLLLFGKNGFLGRPLQQIGMNFIFTWQAAVITAVVVSFPLMYRTSLGALEQIEPNIILAARTLGRSEWSIFWQVLIPLGYRGIVAGTILAFARALGEFGATLMLAGNIPGQTQTMSVAIFFASESGDYSTALIWVSILLLISLSVIITVNFWAETKRDQRSVHRPNLKRRSLISQLQKISWRKVSNHQAIKHFHTGEGLFIDIQKQYADFVLDVTLENNLEPLGLLGASGSGKSMTLRCIAGLETPDRGLIHVNGQVWFDSQRKINLPPCQRKVGFVFQNYALFPHLTVRQNIAFGVQNLPKAEQQRRVNLKIRQMHLEDLENRYPAQLSGGQQQRVAIARALAIEPEVLLLDEPFSALDTQLRSQMEKNLLETLSLYPGITLMVSHNLEEIYRICQNLLVISDGKVLSYGDKQQIFQQPQIYEVARLTGCKNFSPIEILSSHQVKALDWGCILTLPQAIPQTATQIGIRAHHLLFEELEALKIKPKKHQKISRSVEIGENFDHKAEATPQSFSMLEETVSNRFPCWLVQNSETPFRITLYIKLNTPPQHYQDYHLQVELYKENWLLLKEFAFPWHCRLDPSRLFFVE
ncbi:MAG: molybdate ABC transporter permease subunit [Snowella sp.]|nr:molybdate ABC transporter permease subunit [Snowella sp.]